jgi:isopenicillin N synthase-like dioxygenase
MTVPILDVDLLAFEKGDSATRRAVVDGVRRSLETGFVYVAHDVPADLLDRAYGMLAEFFALAEDRKARWVAPGSFGQRGYTETLVETAAGADRADWKEMLNWGSDLPRDHPLRRRYPEQYPDQVLPEDDVPGIAAVLATFHKLVLEVQRRFLRIVGLGVGCRESFFDELLVDGATLTRAIHYPPMAMAPAPGHVWAHPHTDINLITALPRASGPGLELLTPEGWIEVAAPDGAMIINSGLMLARLTNGLIPAGHHRVTAEAGATTGDRYSVVQFCHPASWFVLHPLPSCVTPERPIGYGTIEAGALLQRVLWDIGMVRPA